MQDNKKQVQELFKDLYIIWANFESRLLKVPILERLFNNKFTLEDYRLLLLNQRQQVIEGSRWIALAASSVENEYREIRSLILNHSLTEHKDYKMLEDDYVAAGGYLEHIINHEKNIGSEALSAWMFYQASQKNPFSLFGAMFIIEGLGKHMAHTFATAAKNQLSLEKEQLSFYLHHAEHDEDHLDTLENLLGSGILNNTGLPESILKTARVTARLYLLQLEELGNY
jgi:hypothetical protein